VEFPLPVTQCGVSKEVTLGDRHVIWEPVPDAPNVARIKLVGLSESPSTLLDFEYKLPAGALDGQYSWQSKLYPPQFRGRVVPRQTRWQVTLPSAWAGIPDSAATTMYRWAFRGYLLFPESALTSGDAETWLTGAEPREPEHPVSLTFTRPAYEPTQVWHAPRIAWLMACSGAAVFAFLGFFFLAVPHRLYWGAIVLFTLTAVSAAITWPSAVPFVVVGLEPALIVIAVLLAVHWIVHERYRRQVVFIPGFSRTHANSSVVHAGAKPKTRDLSTIDSPQTAGTSENAAASARPV
jgi:hypothetical protein